MPAADPLPPFIVKSEGALTALRYWLRDLHAINDIDPTATDRFGHRLIKLGWETHPGSDWSRYTRAGLVIVKEPLLFDRALAICEEHLARLRKDDL